MRTEKGHRPLTDATCRTAQPRAKAYKLTDAKGLYLKVLPSGYRSWHWKYHYPAGANQARYKVFGPYPEVSLTEARNRRDDGRKLIRDGIDPAAARKAPIGALGPTFEDYARAWHEDQSTLWKPVHAAQVLSSLVRDVFPAIGTTPIGEVRPGQVRDLLKAIQGRGAVDIAHRVRGRISAVFGRALAEELVELDPAAAVAAVLKPFRSGSMPALTDLDHARAFLRKVEEADGQPVTRLASRLVALTAVRPGVARLAPRTGEFAGLTGDEPLWTVPAARMKLEREASLQAAFDHLVPLSRQAADVVMVAQRHAKRSPVLFPGIRNAHKPISDSTLSGAYRGIKGWEGRHVPHGWRSTFSSVMNERAALAGRAGDGDVIELMLAHKIAGVRGIYMRAAHMQRRREIAQEWADALLAGFPPAEALLEGPRH